MARLNAVPPGYASGIPKGLNTLAQGCGEVGLTNFVATLGYLFHGFSAEPRGLPSLGMLPRTKQSTAYFVLGNMPTIHHDFSSDDC